MRAARGQFIHCFKAWRVLACGCRIKQPRDGRKCKHHPNHESFCFIITMCDRHDLEHDEDGSLACSCFPCHLAGQDYAGTMAGLTSAIEDYALRDV